MARSGKLTQVEFTRAKPREKVYRKADGRGLCLEIHPTGARYWRFRYPHAGKARMSALGVYPEFTLADARLRCLEASKLLSSGGDPVQAKRTEKARLAVAVANTFEAVAREWLAKETGTLAAVTLTKARWMLETFAFPRIGTRPISEIQPPELLDVLRRVESAGKIETAHRVRSRCSQVFRYAIATHRAQSDPTRDLAGALRTKKAKAPGGTDKSPPHRRIDARDRCLRWPVRHQGRSAVGAIGVRAPRRASWCAVGRV